MKSHDSKSERSIWLDQRVDFDWSRALPFSLGAFGSRCSTTPLPAHASGADLSSRPRAHSTKKRVGVRHRRHRSDGLELPELIRDSSVSERGGTVLVSNPFGPVLVSSAHWPSEPAGPVGRDGWGCCPCSDHCRLRGRVSSSAATRDAMGSVLWRWRSCFGLLRSDYRRCSSAVAPLMSARSCKPQRIPGLCNASLAMS